MSKASNNIYIIVDFDSIVKNITATGNNRNHYKNCEKYVTYEGENVNGNTITLIKNKDYNFELQATKGNQSMPTKLYRFKDTDLTLSREGMNERILLCTATKIDKVGYEVTMHAQFIDSKGKTLEATWDPRIVVDIDPS